MALRGKPERRQWHGPVEPQPKTSCRKAQGFGAIPEHLEKLRDLGVITAEYVESQRVHSEELRANINSMILNQQQTRENKDRQHFGKMRVETKASK
jgi:hypothetical protein